MAFDFVKNIYRRIRGVFNKNFLRSIAEVAEIQNVTSVNMMNAIELWLSMYSGDVPWANGQSLELPSSIATEIARLVTLEMEVNISGSPMADYITEQIKPLLDDIKHTTEYACAGGGMVFKPYVCDDKITIEIIQANAFFPIAFNSAQKITAAYFLYQHFEGRKIYTRFERHELNGTDYTITNKAYCSTIEEALGKPCSLSEVEEWADIQPEVHLENIESPLFAYFKIPVGNTVELNSPLGASVFSRAVDLIKEADMQFQRLLWEYQGGELAIDASEDAFMKVNGKPVLPEGKERLFRTNILDAVTTKGENLLKAWTPVLRDSNYMSGLDRLLLQIEDACCLSRGTLTDADISARTATEINMMKQRSYALVKDIQTSLGKALDDLIYAMYCISTLYDLAPNGSYKTAYVWDDSIIIDAEAERIRDMQEVTNGLMLPWEYRVKWYGEDEATAKKKLGLLDGMTDDEILEFDTKKNDSGNNKGGDNTNVDGD